MRRTGRRLGRVAVLAGVVGATVGLVPGVAGAGGGCHTTLYEEARGTVVTADLMCFAPTVLRVDEGTVVRFRNDDTTGHMFTGVAETFGDFTELTQGEWTEFRFDANGVYPFYCLLHPGMVGAVVVGDGSGPGPATAGTSVVRVASGDEDGPADATGAAAAPVTEGATELEAASVTAEPAARGWWTGLGLGAVAAAGLVFLMGARRRRAAALVDVRAGSEDQPA